MTTKTKTIDINPALFNIGSKTKKNRDKTKVTNIKPLISPNVLKSTLIKRIKQHKLKEITNLEDSNKSSEKVDLISYTDEFNDSINYLKTLSKQKKINEEKEKYERNKQLRKEELERKTLKNYSNINNSQIVNVDLPEELEKPLIFVNTEQMNIDKDKNFNLNTPYKIDSIPYGVLKGGVKPTYRNWNKTQRNINDSSVINIHNYQNNNKINERENRLNILKEKIKQKQLEENNKPLFASSNINNPEIKIENNLALNNLVNIKNDEKNENKNNFINNGDNNNLISESVCNNLQEHPVVHIENATSIKRITKKTIKRKYTLGKSNIKKKVSVLLKDRSTRKQILAAHKDLKKKQINDIKIYLRDHNLIKIGSNAPNDVLRKIFESSVLAGDITNNNKDILMHNLIKDDSMK
jgi:hypothetical protein